MPPFVLDCSGRRADLPVCCETIWTPPDQYHGRACAKPVKAERDGKHYCAIHDPERVKAKRLERDLSWASDYNKRAAAAAKDLVFLDIAHEAVKQFEGDCDWAAVENAVKRWKEMP